MSEYDVAKRAASMAYARKVCGEVPPGKAGYFGGFDFQNVVNAAAVPSGRHVDQHRAAWADFYRLFDQEWRQWAA